VTNHVSPGSTTARAWGGRRGIVFLAGCLLALLLGPVGCALLESKRYHEEHVVTNLTVVLMDQKTLQNKWREIAKKSPSKRVSIPAGPDQTLTVDSTVRGFFDFSTNTIYCPKLNFEVCGHELFHALIGRFHPE